MKAGKKLMRVAAVTLSVALGCGTLGMITACGNSTDTLVIMTEELNGLFNPFFSTTGTDMSVVGQTQLSMLSTNGEGGVAFGDSEAVVVKDYESKRVGTQTEYDFVIKNGITFSDGVPLTMNDVMFSIYVYLDPAYTGSTTMYSTKIEGLQAYRTQQSSSGSGSEEDAALNNSALGRANNRILELVNLFQSTGRQGSGANVTYEADEATMRDAISRYTPSAGYKLSIGEESMSDEAAREQLLADYNKTLEVFREELENDFNASKDSYTGAPYTNVDSDGDGKVEVTNDTGVKFDEVVSFMYTEGYVELEYYKDPETNKEDKNRIVKVTKNYNASTVEVSDKEQARQKAIDYVYNDNVTSKFHLILTGWATANTMLTDFTAKAKDVILHDRLQNGELAVKNISGIQSLGHNSSETQVTVNGHDYKVAREHNADGTPKNADEYDVLRIRIDGTDPKAIWNFGFSVAPYHYYSDPDKYPVDLTANQFGVEWASFDFMTKVIQGNNSNGVSKNKVPLGAGPYVASDEKGSDSPTASGFNNSNIVYYKANESFLLGAPKIKKMCYQVVSSSNALNQLEKGSVHFVEPQFTKANSDRINNELKKKGFDSVSTWQLGYGYIGINAGKVPSLPLRKAIMSAMNIKLALDYYEAGTVANISWPMSLVSWAYPRTAGNKLDPANPLKNDLKDNEHAYTMFSDDETAKAQIRDFMSQANASQGDSRLTLRFTIAGSNLTEHPCYAVFKHAADLLNECGWNVEVLPDTNALIKLSTGSLAVWAAAWGSTIDPDMYQVYHKNSTATSVYSWGYREILNQQSRYHEENEILNVLSQKIDEARETDVQSERADLYKEAMKCVLDLAVELPVYQRQTLYAYNTKVINKDTLPKEINSYTSPLDKIWEIEFAK